MVKTGDKEPPRRENIQKTIVEKSYGKYRNLTYRRQICHSAGLNIYLQPNQKFLPFYPAKKHPHRSTEKADLYLRQPIHPPKKSGKYGPPILCNKPPFRQIKGIATVFFHCQKQAENTPDLPPDFPQMRVKTGGINPMEILIRSPLP